jgi:phage gp29-like protein
LTLNADSVLCDQTQTYQGTENMAEIQKPNTQELAPPESSAAGISEPYLRLLSNPDGVMSSRGGTFTVYTEVARDDQVKSTFQQRRLAVVSAPWEVDPGIENNRAAKKAADALRENLKRINFDNVTEKQLWSVFWGFGVAEIMWQLNGGMVDFDIKVRDRSRFRFDIDGNLFLQRLTGTYDQMPDRKFWVTRTGSDHDDNPYGLGLAHWLYWPVYFKRNDIKFWLIFLEKFGMPTAVGTAPTGQANDPAFRGKLLAALRSISTDTAVIIPEGAQVQLMEAARSGSGTYDTMKEAMDAAIAKIVLSQTMTTDNGSSRSQSETHAGVRDMVVQADSDLICESFNNTVVKWWCEYNFPGVVPPRVWRNTSPPEDLSMRAERDTKIISLGYEPTEEYIKETYGEGWVKKQAANAIVDAMGNPLARQQQGQDPSLDPQFAEIAALAALKAGNRADQATIVEASRRFADQYQDVIGERVNELLAYADESGDYETFQKRLVELMGMQPSQQTVEKVQRANFVSRLMGKFRAQR